MKLGSASVNLVSDGYLSKDGGALFGRVPKMDWEQAIKPDRRNRVKMGINLLLVQTPKFNILVDTGQAIKTMYKAIKTWRGSNTCTLWAI